MTILEELSQYIECKYGRSRKLKGWPFRIRFSSTHLTGSTGAGSSRARISLLSSKNSLEICKIRSCILRLFAQLIQSTLNLTRHQDFRQTFKSDERRPSPHMLNLLLKIPRYDIPIESEQTILAQNIVIEPDRLVPSARVRPSTPTPTTPPNTNHKQTPQSN